MKTAKICNRPNTQGYAKDLDTDLSNLFLLAQGRVRFGDGVTGARGENISGEFHTITTAGANVEYTLAHTLGSIPIGYIVLGRNKAAHLFNGTTTWTSSAIYLKSNVTTVVFNLFLLK